MDFGNHIYYFACPRAGCGQVYQVREIADRRAYSDFGRLICPYCGWAIHPSPWAASVRVLLTQDQQAFVRSHSLRQIGRLEVAGRLFDP